MEGDDDARYLQIIFDRKNPSHSPNQIVFWSFRGIANIFEKIGTYKEVFNQFKNEKTLWEKSILLFDRDDFTAAQHTKLRTKLADKLGIPVYTWETYTLESTVLTNTDTFIQVVASYLRTLGHLVDVGRLRSTIQNEMDALLERCRARLDKKEHQTGIFVRLKDKRAKLQDRLDLHDIIGPDATLWPDYFADAKEAISTRNVARFAG